MPSATGHAATPADAPTTAASSSADLTIAPPPTSSRSPTRLPEKLPFEGDRLHADNSPHGDVELGMAGLPGGPLDGSKEVGAKEGEPPRVMEYPDGGWRAWSVVGGAFCISFVTWGYVNAFGVYQAHYQLNQLSEKAPADISWIGSVQLAMVLGCAIVSGKAFDAGYIKYLLVGGTVIYTASLFGLSFASSYAEIFIAQGVGCGLAAGIIFVPAISSISHHFSTRRATALGIAACGSSIGGVVYPLLLNKLFNSSVGFAWGVRASAFLTLGMLIIACLTIQTRLPPRRTGTFIDFTVFKDPAYSIFVAGTFIMMWGIYTPFFYLQSYARANGVDRDLAFYALSILNAASLFGRLIPNWLADTYGPLTVLIPNCLVSGMLIFVWIKAGTSEAGIIAFSIFFGFASGAYVSMMPACIASLTEHMNEMGIRMAMAFLVVSLAALTGTPISGAIITHQNGSYTGAAICSGVMVIVGSLVLILARVVVVRKKGTQWV